MPTYETGRPGAHQAATQKSGRDCSQDTAAHRPITSSGQVSWWEVHEWVDQKLRKVGDFPMAGTPAWVVLPDNDPRKWAAVLDFGQHHALRVETCQRADCQASHDVSAAADWSAIARYLADERAFYAAKPWLRRKATS